MKRYDIIRSEFDLRLGQRTFGRYMLHSDAIAHLARIREAAERAHAEWCLGKVFNAESNRAISKAFDDLLASIGGE